MIFPACTGATLSPSVTRRTDAYIKRRDACSTPEYSNESHRCRREFRSKFTPANLSLKFKNMWPLLAVVVALVDTATSRTESLDIKSVQNAIPQLRMNSVFRRPEVDQLDKFDSSGAAGPFSEDLSALDGGKYQNGFEPFKKLSVIDDLDGSTDERVSLVEEDDDTDIDQLSAFLTQLLQEPGGWEAPLVLVEEPIPWEGSMVDNSPDGSEALPSPWKRSRYYRRYPWKRQNARSRYDDGSRYLCTPTREDVFQLLVALHEQRQGNKSRTVNFCNRRRPAGAVFTNIRFLGRRK